MIAAVTREMRFVIIATVIVAAATTGFYFLGRHIRYALEDRPHVASIKWHLRTLVAGQTAYRSDGPAYATDVMRVWEPPADSTARGIRLRITAADADGFIAEGRSDYWTGRCVVALGRSAGDSLPPGEPVCYRD